MEENFSYGHRELIDVAMRASLEAGKVIMEVYGEKGLVVKSKADNSPVTAADLRADEAIAGVLGITGLPVLSEEGRDIPFAERQEWKRLWIVDPLDGTREFINRNGEFTVNIALVEEGKPVAGVVYAPVSDVLYAGGRGLGAWRTDGASEAFTSDPYLPEKGTPMPFVHRSGYGIVASRSFRDKRTDNFIRMFAARFGNTRIVTRGSSLKLCMLAEGEADIYPRFGNISEWDTAAGHAIVLASGGHVVEALRIDRELVYNKEVSCNPWFIAFRDHKLLEGVTDLIPGGD